MQLIGNLRAVLFIALPGEEQHFVIRVGCEDFSFDGLTILMVPATLGQLEEIAKLSQRKDDLEEDYNKLSGSLDTLLNSFADLGSSLRDTADGLDQLNHARDTISNGKDQIYADGDKVLNDLESLNNSLNTIPGHLDDADDSITEVTDSLSEVTDTAVSLRENLDDVDDCLKDLQRDIKNIRSGSGDMQSHLNQLGADLKKAANQFAGAERNTSASGHPHQRWTDFRTAQQCTGKDQSSGTAVGCRADTSTGIGNRLGRCGEGQRRAAYGNHRIPAIPNCRPDCQRKGIVSRRCRWPASAGAGR